MEKIYLKRNHQWNTLRDTCRFYFYESTKVATNYLISFKKMNDETEMSKIIFIKVQTMHSIHCVKSVQIRSSFWLSQSEYRKVRTRKNSVLGHISHSDTLSDLILKFLLFLLNGKIQYPKC